MSVWIKASPSGRCGWRAAISGAVARPSFEPRWFGDGGRDQQHVWRHRPPAESEVTAERSCHRPDWPRRSAPGGRGGSDDCCAAEVADQRASDAIFFGIRTVTGVPGTIIPRAASRSRRRCLPRRHDGGRPSRILSRRGLGWRRSKRRGVGTGAASTTIRARRCGYRRALPSSLFSARAQARHVDRRRIGDGATPNISAARSRARAARRCVGRSFIVPVTNHAEWIIRDHSGRRAPRRRRRGQTPSLGAVDRRSGVTTS